MGRRASWYAPRPDGSTLAVGFADVGGVFRAWFLGPNGKRCQWSTGVCVPAKWKTGDRVPAEATQVAARLVAKAYEGTMAPDPLKTGWDDALAKLDAAHISPKTLETCRTAVGNLRAVLPDVPGPAHLTPDMARMFAADFAAGTFRRANAEDARAYRRSPQTVFNAVANLSIVWNHFRDLGLAKVNPWEVVKRPRLPKRVPRVPDEDTLRTFFGWLETRYPGWELMRLFVRVKMLTGRRLADLCQIRADQLVGETLTIQPEQDKTHREVVFPLPKELADALHRLKGPMFLWEQYTLDTRTYRPGKRRSDVFTPTIFYNAVKSIFREYNHAHPEAKLRTHDLRKRALTLGALASGNVDETAQAFGIDPQTARRFYVDASRAANAGDLLKRLASALEPPARVGEVLR